MTEKLYQDKDWLYEQYWVQKKSLPQIAKIAGCTSVTILYWMRKFDIARRTLTESAHLFTQDPKWYEKTTRGARRRSQDPAWQKANIEAAHRRAQDPAWQKANAEANRRQAQDPAWQKAHAEAMQRLAQDPKWRKKQAVGSSRRSQDPEYQRRWAEGMRHLALKKRGQGMMTDIEVIVYNALRDLGLKESKDFDFEVPTKGGYIVDFLIHSHNIVLEAYGEYWHTLSDRQEYDAERKQYLEACGYTVLEWWGPDIKADVWKLIDEELLPLLDQPSRIERPPRGVSRPYRGPHGWQSAVQLSLFDKEPDD